MLFTGQTTTFRAVVNCGLWYKTLNRRGRPRDSPLHAPIGRASHGIRLLNRHSVHQTIIILPSFEQTTFCLSPSINFISACSVYLLSCTLEREIERA